MSNDFKFVEFKEKTSIKTTGDPGKKVEVKLPLEGCGVSIGKGCLLPVVLILLIYILFRVAVLVSSPAFHF